MGIQLWEIVMYLIFAFLVVYAGYAFYEKMGFRRCGSKDFVLGDDVQQDWIMTLKIS